MSLETLKRLPLYLRQLLRIYEKGTTRLSVNKDSNVKGFLRKTSDEYGNFQAYKLIRENEFNHRDFPPAVAKSLEPLFNTRLQLTDLEKLSTRDLFRKDVFSTITDEDDSIHSSYSRTTTSTTDFQAKIITTLAAQVSPFLSVPKQLSIEKSFKWFVKLLQSTPVFLILKQRSRLFSEGSLNQYDMPFNSLKTKVTEISNRKAEEVASREVESQNSSEIYRNYHLTDLLRIDLFNLAIKSQTDFDNHPISQFEDILNGLRWKEVNQRKDKLCDLLTESQNVQLVDKTFSNVELRNFKHFIETKNIWKTLATSKESDVRSLLPFDLTYNNYYLLCIENLVLDSDHSQVLEAVSKSDFEVIAARISLQNSDIINFFTDLIQQSSDTHSRKLNYEELLQIAHANREPHVSGINDLMKHLAEMNLVTVEEGCDKNCIYFLPGNRP